MVAFSNKLQMFAMFDQHAVHERIRYEYYSALFKQENGRGEGSPISSDIVEKVGKNLKSIYGCTVRMLELAVPEATLLFPDGKSKTVTIKGISLQRDGPKVWITSYRPILDRKFTLEELNSILKSVISDREREPVSIDEWIGEYSCKNAYKFND